MILEPLSTIGSIQEAVKQDPSLRVSLAEKYQALGGTLSNGAIPLPYKEEIPAGYTKTSPGVYQPTVIASANINEKIISDLTSKLKDMSETGTFTDKDGTTRTADGVPVPEKDENETYLKNLADFNRKFGRQPNDTTGIKKVAGGGIDTSGAFDEQGGVLGATKQPTKEEEALDDTYKQQQDLIDQMRTTLDAQTKRQIDSIEALFNVRRQQQAEIDRRQKEGIEQSLLMGGSSRYAQISSANIVAAKENASLMNIAQLDAEEKSLINSALAAKENGDFKLLEKKLDLAETKRKEKQTEAEKLSKTIAEENKRLREEMQKEATALQKDIDGIAEDAAKNGAPADVITKITSAKTRGVAIKEAGEYLKTGTGIIAEYNFYKKEAEAKGQVPLSFDDYQTKDVNRKISIAKASQPVAGTELTTQQQAVFNRIIDKFNASEAIKAMDRASKLRDIIAEVEKNPNSPAQQLNLIYAYIKGLDTESAVREGEIDLVRSINSYLGKFQLAFEKITSGKPITAKVALEIANGSKTLINSIENTAKRKTAVFDAQAKQNGNAVYGAWKGFRETMEKSQFNIGDEIINSEQEAEYNLKNYIQNNPAKKIEIDAQIKQIETSMGRPITSEEFLQAFPEYK